MTAAPFKVQVPVSGYPANTVINVQATVTMSDGTVQYVSYSGRAREVNYPPRGIALSSAVISENLAIGTPLGSLTTDDPNLLDTHTYQIVPNVAPDAVAPFVLSGSQVFQSAPINFEVNPTFKLQITSTDDSGLSLTTTFVVTITDANDVSTGIQIVARNGTLITTVDENSPRNFVVGYMRAVDEDCCDTHRFSIVDGTNTFALTYNSSIGLTQLVVIGSIDFETLNLYTLLFTTDDDRGPTFQMYVNLGVRDINEAPNDLYLIMPLTLSIILSVNETAPLNYVVGTFGFGDPDCCQSHAYSLLPSSPTPPFNVSQASPAAPAYLVTTGTLNYDLVPQYTVSVRVVCGGPHGRAELRRRVVGAVVNLAAHVACCGCVFSVGNRST